MTSKSPDNPTSGEPTPKEQALESESSKPALNVSPPQECSESVDEEQQCPKVPCQQRRRRRCSELMEDCSDVLQEQPPPTGGTEHDHGAPVPRNEPTTTHAVHPVHHAERRTSELVESLTAIHTFQEELANPRRRSSILEDPNEKSYHPVSLKLYSPPIQRQRWGQRQILPRVNWGDLFFDLFYVAAAYNASNILTEAPSGEGCLYFLATFISVQHIWYMKMSYDARFVLQGDDVVHRTVEVLDLVILASVVLHIHPASVLSQTHDYVDMFGLSISLFCCWLVRFVKYIELCFFARGERELCYVMAVKECKIIAIGLGLYLAAAIIAGKDYFSSSNNSIDTYSDYDSQVHDDHRLLADFGTNYNATDDDGRSGTDYDDHYSSSSETAVLVNHVPIWLVLVVPIINYVIYFVRFVIIFPNDGSHKKYMVPMNVDFAIHRMGEWTMLMLGEPILSLLIEYVPDKSVGYLGTFYCSLVTVVLLQYLHFESMPHHADDHVLRRSKNRGMVFNLLSYAYSCSLIALGAAYTLFLQLFAIAEDETVYGNYDDDSHRILSPNASLFNTMIPGGEARAVRADSFRLLAATGDSAYSPEDLASRAANMFSIALAVFFFSLDGMSLMHVGFKHSQARCQCQKSKILNMKGLVILSLRAGVLLFVATLSQWKTDPEHLAALGLAATAIQVVFRKLGQLYLSRKMELQTDSERDGSLMEEMNELASVEEDA
eukprot:Nitzschia sp. Nitz4//scaffold31_size150131//3535//5854//NITZ4_002807-RA/size150131-processed-gene-0.124-mRNA-1//-1//CDS//3329547596//7462//frame0